MSMDSVCAAIVLEYGWLFEDADGVLHVPALRNDQVWAECGRDHTVMAFEFSPSIHAQFCNGCVGSWMESALNEVR